MTYYIYYYNKEYFDKKHNYTFKAGDIFYIITNNSNEEWKKKNPDIDILEYEIEEDKIEETLSQLGNCIIDLETKKPVYSEEKERASNRQKQRFLAQEIQQEDLMKIFLIALDDEKASKIPLMYQNWEEYEDGYIFKVNDRVEYKDKLWKCLQDHDKQVNREPDIAVSLWVIAYTEEYPEWKQPTGAHDAYNTGDKCTYQGKKYISKINGNTTIPGSDNRYWEEVV